MRSAWDTVYLLSCGRASLLTAMHTVRSMGVHAFRYFDRTSYDIQFSRYKKIGIYFKWIQLSRQE